MLRGEGANSARDSGSLIPRRDGGDNAREAARRLAERAFRWGMGLPELLPVCAAEEEQVEPEGQACRGGQFKWHSGALSRAAHSGFELSQHPRSEEHTSE